MCLAPAVQPDSDFECISVMMEHTQDVKALAWHPKEEVCHMTSFELHNQLKTSSIQILASASYDASILLFADDPDADWGPFQKLQPTLPAQNPDVSPDLKDHLSRPTAATQSAGDDVEAGDTTRADGDEFVVPPLKEPETIWSLAFSPCGMYLASGGDNGGIRLWARG